MLLVLRLASNAVYNRTVGRGDCNWHAVAWAGADGSHNNTIDPELRVYGKVPSAKLAAAAVNGACVNASLPGCERPRASVMLP